MRSSDSKRDRKNSKQQHEQEQDGKDEHGTSFLLCRLLFLPPSFLQVRSHHYSLRLHPKRERPHEVGM